MRRERLLHVFELMKTYLVPRFHDICIQSCIIKYQCTLDIYRTAFRSNHKLNAHGVSVSN